LSLLFPTAAVNTATLANFGAFVRTKVRLGWVLYAKNELETIPNPND